MAIKVLITWTGNNFGAASEDVLGCVATADSLNEVRSAYESALRFHVEGMIEDGDIIPEELQGDLVFSFSLSAQAKLKYLNNFVTMTALSKATGINKRQLGHYIQGVKKPRLEQINKITIGIKSIQKQLSEIV